MCVSEGSMTGVPLPGYDLCVCVDYVLCLDYDQGIYVRGCGSIYLKPVLFSGLASLINRMNKPEITIAVDGSLYRFHPRFHNLMCLKIQELVKPGLKVSCRTKNHCDRNAFSHCPSQNLKTNMKFVSWGDVLSGDVLTNQIVFFEMLFGNCFL